MPTKIFPCRRRIVQYFERAVFAYHPEDGSVRLEPLGWEALVRERLRGAGGCGAADSAVSLSYQSHTTTCSNVGNQAFSDTH